MDNHPIPQDVTGFQFRLIGNMTVKQFGYVAAGVILAVVTYYVPGNSALTWLFIKLPLVLLFGGGGAALAFLPVEGRPIDVMVVNFFKAVVSPNQFLYHKQGHVYAATSFTRNQIKTKSDQDASVSRELIRQQQLQTYLQTLSSTTQNSLDQKEAKYLQSVFGNVPQVMPYPTLQSSNSASQPSQSEPLPDIPEKKQVENTEQALTVKAEVLEKELETAKRNETLQVTSQQKQVAHQQTTNLETQLQAILAQKAQLEKELALLQQQLPQTQPATPEPQPIVTQQPQPATEQQPQTTQNSSQFVRTIPTNLAKGLGIASAPDVPNLIAGIVKDPRGNVLSGILVEMSDKDGNPVRAFKTNPLGQFASATALTNGEYTITLEDPKGQHAFEAISITVNGSIIPPLEIISHDEREALRQSLFG